MESQVLLLSNLPFLDNEKTVIKIIYGLFNRFGKIIQMRWGCQGNILVVFEEIGDAIDAYKHLNGYLLEDKSLNIEYFQVIDSFRKKEEIKRKERVNKLKNKIGDI